MDDAHQNCPKYVYFFCKFCTFSVTEGYAIWHSISSSQPRQESSPTRQNLSISGCRKTRILGMPGFFGTLGQRNAKNQPQKDMNFGNAIILWHFRPEKCQNPTQKDTNFGNAIILCYLGPENHQIQPQKT